MIEKMNAELLKALTEAGFVKKNGYMFKEMRAMDLPYVLEHIVDGNEVFENQKTDIKVNHESVVLTIYNEIFVPNQKQDYTSNYFEAYDFANEMDAAISMLKDAKVEISADKIVSEGPQL
jgi:hypothetical protein